MFDHKYEFDYDKVVEDSDELYSDDEHDYDYANEREYDLYYHNVMDELDTE
jgi:hypothetical protein